MKSQAGLIGLAALMLGAPVWAANHVTVESKSVRPGATGAQVDVFLENDVPLQAIVLTFEIRETTPGSYITNSLAIAIVPGNRVDQSPLGAAAGASIVIHYYPTPGGAPCSGPTANTYQIIGPPDFVSPDGLLAGTVSTIPDPPFTMDPGADFASCGFGSFALTFDVTGVEGQFEVDTCCVFPVNHLSFVDENSALIPPTFTKGVITIDDAAPDAKYPCCPCPCPSDPVCDGVLDVRDVLAVVDAAFGGIEPSDPTCPVSRTNVDGAGGTSVTDIVRIVNVVMLGFDPSILYDPNPQPCRDTLDAGCPTGPPPAGNTVVIESRQVAPGATGVQIGVYVNNAVDLSALVLPLEVRSMTPGSFTSTTFNLTHQGRLVAPPPLSINKRYYKDPDLTNPCSGPISSSYSMGASTPTGFFTSPDGVMWSGYYQTDCLPAGSDGTPGAGTPSLLFTFDVTSTVGTFEIDTGCVTPGNHLMFVDCTTNDCIVPAFTRGTVTIGTPPLLSCARSTTDRYLLACPRGDIAFAVTLRNSTGQPVVGYSTVELDFSDCTVGELLPQPGAYPNWPIVAATEQSDANGVLRFQIAAGGDCADCNVTVRSADCGVIATVPVRSVDVDGDAWVLPNDADPIQGLCRDVNADGVVDEDDLSRIADHLFHRYPTGNCDWLAQKLDPVPDAGFLPLDTILIRYTLENNPSGGTCQIDSIVFYDGEFSTTPTWRYLATHTPGIILTRGSTYMDSLDYIVPADGRMCLRALLYSSCCAQPQEVVRCVETELQCPPGAVCFDFVALRLADADSVRELPVSPFPAGWIHFVDPRTADSTFYVICTAAGTPIGTSGAVLVVYWVNGVPGWFYFRVKQSWFNGDMCGGPNGQVDCVVNVQDVVCVVNLVFRGSVPPIPNPEAHGDVNCDAIYDVRDVVALVDYVFRGGEPPVDCGAGPKAN